MIINMYINKKYLVILINYYWINIATDFIYILQRILIVITYLGCDNMIPKDESYMDYSSEIL